ncbi:hypothetical protein [Mycobacterium tuberculosis]
MSYLVVRGASGGSASAAAAVMRWPAAANERSGHAVGVGLGPEAIGSW